MNNRERRITIVTSIKRNSENLIPTLLSINLAAKMARDRVTLQHIIKSAETSLDLEKILAQHTSNDVDRQHFSEPDAGFYHGLVQGFSRATGDILGFLNCGDLLVPWGLVALHDAFERQSDVEWVTGNGTVLDPRDGRISVASSYRYTNSLIESGAYGRILPFLQQESTYFSRRLYDSLDKTKLASFKLAGDLYIWNVFSRSSRLHIIDSQVGVFVKEIGQLSSNLDKYWAEAEANGLVTMRLRAWMDFLPNAVGWAMHRAPRILSARRGKKFRARLGHWSE